MNIIIVAVVVIAAAFAVTHLHLLPKIEALLHKHASTAGSGVVVTVNSGNGSAPAPSVGGGGATPTPPDHAATPPANAGSTGSQSGAVPGGDTPDANGAIAIPAIAAKFPPNSRFLTVATLQFVPKASAQAFCISANCQNVKFLEGAFVNVPDFSNYMPLAAVANPPEAANVGGALFHLQGQLPGEARTFIPNCIAISNELTTIDQVVGYCAKLPIYGTGYVKAPVA